MADSKNNVFLNDLMVFRQFRFLVPVEWDAKIQKLILESRKRKQHDLQKRMLCDQDDEDKDGADARAAKQKASKKVASSAALVVEADTVEGAGSVSSCAAASTDVIESTSKPSKLQTGVKLPVDAASKMALFYPKKR